MTKAAAKKLEAQMYWWRNLLGLAGWGLSLHVYERPELPPEVCKGEVLTGRLEPWVRHGKAIIHAAEFAEGEPPEEIILHEEHHLQLSEMGAALSRAEAHLSPGVFAVIKAEYDDAEERAVIRLTKAALALCDGAGGEKP